MTEYEGRYDGNGEDAGTYADGGSSPQPRAAVHGGADDYNDSKSQLVNLGVWGFLGQGFCIELSVNQGLLNCMSLVITRENLQRAEKRIEIKGVIRRGTGTGTEIETGGEVRTRIGKGIGTEIGLGIGIVIEKEKGTGTGIAIVITETATGIAREVSDGETRTTTTMVTTVPGTLIDGGIMTETERIGIGTSPGLVQELDLSTNPDRGHALVHAPKGISLGKRISGFDMAPPASAMLAGAAVAAAGQIPGTSPTIPGMFPNMFPLSTSQQFAPLPVMPVQAMTQQATRHARRVYVGGLPPTANEQSVATFFSQVMAAIGGNTAGPGDAVVNVYINHEKKFAFVEMRSVEEASNAMALDGIIFEGAPVKVRRPSDYNPSLAATLGPSQPNPNLNLAAVGLTPGSAGGLEGPDRIFVGGLPYYFTEAQIKELLESFGPLRGFDLVKDRETGNSKGYAFCVYQDLSVTDIACAALNGIKMGDKTLTVRRANQGANQPKPEQESVLLHAQQQIALQTLTVRRANQGANQPKPEQESVLLHAQQQIALQRFMLLQPPSSVATKVVCLTQVVTADELRDDTEYDDILEDMRLEGEKFGALVNVIIPRPRPDGELAPGVGKVFLEYADTDGSTKARTGLNGRKFGGNQVVAVFYPEDKFGQRDYEG
ncbi:hypothetical protein C1H46_005254 [Malus baccata]|uniref:RRM domain-containing protein n=1 Tax=Malus baccata TaxID=106549 RepID=A0A540NDJ5_MALBA|nr:hypothetical protein C1H46_005254 [Malus baccata]